MGGMPEAGGFTPISRKIYPVFTAKPGRLWHNGGMTTESISPLLSAMGRQYEPGAASAGASAGTSAEFQKVLSLLLMSQLANPLGSDSSSSSSSSMGSDPLSALMMLLMNQMGCSTASADPFTRSNAPQISLAQAQGLQINQFDADKEMGGDGVNSNCGPTSLLMALRGLDVSLEGVTAGVSNGAAVDKTCEMMVSDSARDGVDGKGRRAEHEQNFFTDFDDLMRGAQAAGASARMLAEKASSIQSALLSGAKVVVSGTFTGKSSLPWTGDRGRDNNSAPGGATMHIVTVSGYNAAAGTFIVNDPARKSAIEVSAETLEHFMEGNAGAMAVWG